MKPSIQSFIDEYLIDHNGAEAARRAGYAASSAKQRAHVLLNRPEVISAIGECHAERRVRDGLHLHEIVTDLSIIARTAPSIAQRLRAYTLVMRYYGMLSAKRPPSDDDPDEFLSNHIIRKQSGLKLAGKPFHDDVEEEEPLDLVSLENLIQDDLAAAIAADANESQPQSADTAPTPSDPDPTDHPGPDSSTATAPQPNPPPPAPRDPAPHRKGPNHGGPAPAGAIAAKPAPMKPAPATSAPVRSAPAPSAPVQPARPAPQWQLPGVEPPRPRRRPHPMHAYIQSVNDPALAEVWAAISGKPDSDVSEKR